MGGAVTSAPPMLIPPGGESVKIDPSEQLTDSYPKVPNWVVHMTRVKSRWYTTILYCQMTTQSIRLKATAATASDIPKWESDAGSFRR